VNIITKSGTNDFHGSAFGYLRNRKFQAQNPFTNTPDPAYTRVQAGLAFGGKFKERQHVLIFFSFETTRRQETGFSTIGRKQFWVGSADQRRKLLAFPRDRWLLQHRPLSWLGLRLRETHYSPCLPATRSLLPADRAWHCWEPGALTALGFFPTSDRLCPHHFITC